MTVREPLTEFELISRYFSAIGPIKSSSVKLGIGDDCAILSLPVGQQLAMSIDTLVAGRHFPDGAQPYDIARRALAVSVSDLAAMGASPVAFTLALTLPDVDQPWLQQFSAGLRDAADYYQLPLIGGDTTQGMLAITVQVHGSLPQNIALKRSGAKPGDAIFVSGNLGDAAVALTLMQQSFDVTSAQQAFLHSRFYQPQAQLALGQQLLGKASAAIDISDGLLADLGHICKASAVAATLYSQQIPLSDVVKDVVDSQRALYYALTGGDDYELCFTAPVVQRAEIIACGQSLAVPITEVGVIAAGDGVQCIDQAGAIVDFPHSGYQHFQ
jgi:thiamine-monophosphate kinase